MNKCNIHLRNCLISQQHPDNIWTNCAYSYTLRCWSICYGLRLVMKTDHLYIFSVIRFAFLTFFTFLLWWENDDVCYWHAHASIQLVNAVTLQDILSLWKTFCNTLWVIPVIWARNGSITIHHMNSEQTYTSSVNTPIHKINWKEEY